MEWFFPVAFLVTFGILYWTARRETTKNALSKKGFIKILSISAIVFAAVVIFVSVWNR
ncbi:hypothetical protein QRD89_10605 [Halobacillus sp. ACCC02827]|uniref:hypothetical protein n=1 Tax=unclassified Halobacillus TaxID=2636472 RepID=UPI0002F2AE43|nr:MULTISPECIES: hypothetical protein [unclassified Halobacillus]WJE14177.1 hypothetical protein QRD89_10605 [Halobacillus sp. ACCC02827]